MSRAQHQPAFGQVLAKGLQPGQKLRRVKQRRAKQRLELRRNPRRTAARQHDIARDEAGLQRMDSDLLQAAVADHRVNLGDWRIEQRAGVHLPGNPGEVIRPFMATGRAPQQPEIEHPPLVLEVHGERKTAARVAWRHQITKHVMVDVGAGEQQFAVPLSVRRSFQVADGKTAQRLIGLPCVLHSAGQRNAGGAETDTNGVRMKRVRYRVTHEIPVLRVGVKRCSWCFRSSSCGSQPCRTKGPDAALRASVLPPVKADGAHRGGENAVMQRRRQWSRAPLAGQPGQHVKHQQAFAEIGVRLAGEKSPVQRGGLTDACGAVGNPEADDEGIAVLFWRAAQMRRGCVVGEHQRSSAASVSSRAPVLAAGLEATGKHLHISTGVATLQPGASQRIAEVGGQRLTVRTVIGLNLYALPSAGRQPVGQIASQLPV
ncbi:hypothetical protein ALP22_05582 [Pseudomonas coronafaciens pv. porri]|nr:Uncharacterized protein ALO89_05380 [Pseudomonas coronafaciens pv. porri]RMU86819.1 hypothetical protein ALP22_05582 [Pseudomonas coronafaciens pv. porri]